MLTLQFIAQNVHFAVSLMAALVFFAVFWLYFDAWVSSVHKNKPDTIKWVGFLLVAISFVPTATLVQQASAGQGIFGSFADTIAAAVRLLGYAGIIVGQIIDPLQKRPDTHSIDAEYSGGTGHSKSSPLVAAGGAGLGVVLALPIAALAIATLYWRRATTGLERHLKPVAYAFVFLFGFELFSLASLFHDATNPAVYDLVKVFGPLWLIGHLCLLIGVAVMGRWVWRYLTERFMSQLFMTFTAVVLAVFLITTVSFTFLLLQNIENNALSNLATATSVLNYALDSKKLTTQANAEALAASPAISQAISAKDHKSLVDLTSNFLETKQEAQLVITTADGEVLLRADNPDHWGDSISSDTLLRRAVIGESSSTVESQSGVLAPVISIRSIVPARDSSGTIVGTISVSTLINNALLDGIKHATGLDAAVYSNDIRSATTFTAPDGHSRWIGIKETNPAVLSTVLKQGKIYTGQLTILSQDYLTAYAPLKDADNTTVGMLFIGKTGASVLETTNYLINLTFVVAASLLVLSVIPAYAVARYITKQLE